MTYLLTGPRGLTDAQATRLNKPGVKELLRMLAYRRPGGSHTELQFIQDFLTPLGAKSDAWGNRRLTINNADGSAPDVLFSSHTDTVHDKAGQQHVVCSKDGYAMTFTKESSCLGADCTTGVWLMRQMALARVPGLYVWHADEERGGLGSSSLAKRDAKSLRGIRFAIAFDRKGLDEVITHQCGTRGASDAFADSLAGILNANGRLSYKPSDDGVFTDTANYTHIVPECCNLSVGYYSQHSSNEKQDVYFADLLLDALLAADWTRLICSRDPAEREVELFDWRNYGTMGGTAVQRNAWRAHRQSSRKGSALALADYVALNPEIVADYLETVGTTLSELEDHEDFLYGKAGDAEDYKSDYEKYLDELWEGNTGKN